MTYSYYLMILSIFCFILGLYSLSTGVSYYLNWTLLFYMSSEFYMSFVFDWMSLMFNSFVLFISSCVMHYSTDYMHGDVTKNRFAILVFLFVVSMLCVINSCSLVCLLLGWDGLSLVSYCLVIYYHNVRSYNAGMITILSNRIGDATLLLAISWLMMSSNWSYIMFYAWGLDNKWVIFLCLVAACTKSAQIPFSAWLPAAMAAPTHVSALVHSSTLVTAGVYLLGDFGLAFNGMYSMLCLLSLLTMFMAGIGANFEYDLKTIIALFTLSQLGLMMFILSVGFVKLAFFHLLTHAMLKLYCSYVLDRLFTLY